MGIGYGIYAIVRPERLAQKGAGPDSSAEPLYEIVAEELRNNSLKQGLWAKAFADANGDDSKARAAYIRYRVAQLQAERSSAVAPIRLDPKITPNDSVPPWKRTARFIGVVFAWLTLISGLIGFLLVASSDVETPGARRFAAQATFNAVVGASILSAVYARQKKAMWFLIGCVGTYVGLLTAATVIRLVHNLLA